MFKIALKIALNYIFGCGNLINITLRVVFAALQVYTFINFLMGSKLSLLFTNIEVLYQVSVTHWPF